MKKKIFYVIDDSKWIQNVKLQRIQRLVGDEYKLKNISSSFNIRSYLSQKLYTPCVFASWRQVLVDDWWKKLPLECCVASVSSHYNIGGGLYPQKAVAKGENSEAVFDKAISILSRFGLVLVNSKNLETLLKPFIENILYIPNGVDSNFFVPRENRTYYSDNIVIGWVGKNKAAKNYELIEEIKPYLAKIGITFKEICLSKNSRSILGKIQMREFYQSLDYYLCTSWHEGTPNPCLEAASCGIPLITTKVGNMPELVDDCKNSFFIKPNIESLKGVLTKISSIDKNKHTCLSNCLRRSIVENWDWSDRKPYFIDLFKRTRLLTD